MSGLLMRLAGPMQSWGEHSAFGQRDTLNHPTRSGVIGLCAAVRGVPREDERLREYDDLRITVRVDRPGVRDVDYQTIGGGLPPKRTVPKSEGGYRPTATATVQTWRPYLSDAVFTVALQGPEELLDVTAEALEHPYWQPYLGRRSFLPEQPLLLRARVVDPVGELRTGVPLPPRALEGRVDFVYESDPGLIAAQGGDDRSRTVLNDVPAPALGGERVFATRDVVATPEKVASELRTSSVPEYREKLLAYVVEGRTR